MNAFAQMCEECGILSKRPADRLITSDCDRVFIEATYQEAQKAKNNNANSICRFEFLEAMIRLAQKKYQIKAFQHKKYVLPLDKGLEKLILL